MAQFSYPKEKIKILLLEKIHPKAEEQLAASGYAVERVQRSLPADELAEYISDIHILGIRSKTKVTAEHISRAKRLLAVGCFGVGTNQVDLAAARSHGVPVFNAPYGNTRSVAELALGNIIMLARKAADKHLKMHQGLWDKTAVGVHEVRGKTIGVIGYGHIGQQVGLLAEAIGMKVLFFDLMKRLSLGNAQVVGSFEEILDKSDFITLHVPAKGDGSPLISKREFALMKKGSYLLNASRGSLVDFAALKEAIEEGQVAGAALDVFPDEPKSNREEYDCGLMGVENVILTPHIGGSTEEAQSNIGLEVATTFIKYLDKGSTMGAVNFPQVELPIQPGAHRILHIHRNEPGVLTEVNRIVSNIGANVQAQTLSTHQDVGYLVMDVDSKLSEQVKTEIKTLGSTIKTRILY